jgi:hypothetical protein
MTVERPATHHTASTRAAASTGAPVAAAPKPAKKEAPPPRMKTIAVDGKRAAGKHDALDDLSNDDFAAKDRGALAKQKNANGENDNKLGSVAGGVYGAGGGRASEPNGNVKSSAPQEIGRAAVAEKAPERDEEAPVQQQRKTSTSSRGYAAPAAPPPPTSMPAPTVSMPEPTSTPPSEGRYRMQAQAAPAGASVQKPSAQSRSYEVLRKQADELAKTNHCDEANKLYQELDNAKQYLSPTERVNWVRCLTHKGREQEAQQRLDELKAEKRVTNAQIQDAERELTDARRKPEPKKAKKAPADRAPAAATESVQQQQRHAPPAEAPAQAAPPDSTNTKVTKPAY